MKLGECHNLKPYDDEQESCAIAKMTARCALHLSDWSFGWGLWILI